MRAEVAQSFHLSRLLGQEETVFLNTPTGTLEKKVACSVHPHPGLSHGEHWPQGTRLSARSPSPAEGGSVSVLHPARSGSGGEVPHG